MANPNPPQEHLRPKPWKKGESGNKRGYSTGRRITDALNRMLDKKNGDETVAAVMYLKTIGDVKALEKLGLKPDVRYLRELLNRIEGKVPDKIETKNVADTTREDQYRDDLDKLWGEE